MTALSPSNFYTLMISSFSFELNLLKNYCTMNLNPPVSKNTSGSIPMLVSSGFLNKLRSSSVYLIAYLQPYNLPTAVPHSSLYVCHSTPSLPYMAPASHQSPQFVSSPYLYASLNSMPHYTPQFQSPVSESNFSSTHLLLFWISLSQSNPSVNGKVRLFLLSVQSERDGGENSQLHNFGQDSHIEVLFVIKYGLFYFF